MDFNFAEQVKSKSNAELIEIFANPHSYQAEFINAVKSEIYGRNIPLDAVEEIRNQKSQLSFDSLSIGKQGNPIYIALIAITALLGGVVAIIGGYIYAYSTHTDSLGNKFYVYNDSTRKWGRIILGLGIAAIFLFIIIRMINS